MRYVVVAQNVDGLLDEVGHWASDHGYDVVDEGVDFSKSGICQLASYLPFFEAKSLCAHLRAHEMRCVWVKHSRFGPAIALAKIQTIWTKTFRLVYVFFWIYLIYINVLACCSEVENFYRLQILVALYITSAHSLVLVIKGFSGNDILVKK